MASIFGFRSRNPARDRQTDVARLDRLAKLFDQIAAEVEAEKSGLESRYRTKATNAAFLVEAMENGAASSSSSAEVSELTRSILNCERRIAALTRQNELMKDIRHSLDEIFDQSAQHGSTTKAALAKPAAGAR
ncbi:hypothetical protein CN311_26890 [Mesorhizobium sanjuanii]|uniref:Uncharacterized protein n=1 Tax=Mesorhizobium sanjuanii TaxID=2037900 RepID=A0A2A6F7V2_9HYPH|nr:hypothetical protein [Mesorhizobium sanjuanii]PDQ18030.1 hypothetical protein CN311_26890 [Mesorhizobium sanjuanii]